MKDPRLAGERAATAFLSETVRTLNFNCDDEMIDRAVYRVHATELSVEDD